MNLLKISCLCFLILLTRQYKLLSQEISWDDIPISWNHFDKQQYGKNIDAYLDVSIDFDFAITNKGNQRGYLVSLGVRIDPSNSTIHPGVLKLSQVEQDAILQREKARSLISVNHFILLRNEFSRLKFSEKLPMEVKEIFTNVKAELSKELRHFNNSINNQSGKNTLIQYQAEILNKFRVLNPEGTLRLTDSFFIPYVEIHEDNYLLKDTFADKHERWTNDSVISAGTVAIVKGGSMYIHNTDKKELYYTLSTLPESLPNHFEIAFTFKLDKANAFTRGGIVAWGGSDDNSGIICTISRNYIAMRPCKGGDHSQCDNIDFRISKLSINMWHRMIIQKMKDHYHIFVNGKYVHTYKMPSYYGKTFGLGATSKSSVYFDEISLLPIDMQE